MKPKPTTLWALVTDSGYGRLLALEKSPQRIAEIEAREAPARHLTTHELMSDASGRDFDATGPGAHSKHQRSDAHEHAEAEFVKAWVERLQEGLSDQSFEHLLLVADPRTLGRLRAQMGKALRQAVVAETNRDLARLPLTELESHLRALAGWTD